MKKFIPFVMLMMAAPLTARADIIHQISASTQLRVDSAATQATRIGSTYSVQGSNIQTAPTTTNNVTTYAAMGGLTKKSGDSTVATQTQAAYQQKNVGEAFSLTESFTLGDESISVSATTGVLIEDYTQTSATSTTSTTTATADDGTVTNTVNTATTPQVQNYGVATALPVFGDTTTTAGGYTGNLAGTITSGGTVTLTAGGAGTTATGQVTSTLTIK